MKSKWKWFVFLYLIALTWVCYHVWHDLPEPAPDWKYAGSLGVGRQLAEAVHYENKIYLFSGFENIDLDVSGRVEIFDLATHQWSMGKAMPTPMTHVDMVQLDNEVWFVGGCSGSGYGIASDVVQIYNISNDTWRMGPSIPMKVCSAEADLIDNGIHVYGGVYDDYQTNSHHHYRLELGNIEAGWQRMKDLPQGGRTHFASVVIDDILYMFGGEYGHHILANGFPDDFKYDIKTDQWSRIANMPMRISHHEQASFVKDGKIMTVGGKSHRMMSIPNIFVYDPKKDEWSEARPLPKPLVSTSALMVDDNLYVIYGAQNSFKFMTDEVREKTFLMEQEYVRPE